MLVGHLLLSFLIEFEEKGLFVRGHSELLEPLRWPVLALFKGSLALQTHLVLKPARIVTVLGEANALQDAATIGGRLFELDVSFLSPSRLETLEQAVYAHLNLMLLRTTPSTTLKDL